MLAALNIGAVLLGVASGGLTASLLSLGIGAGLSLAGLDEGAGVGLMAGIVAGLIAGGWVAGRRARHSWGFHGAVTGLALAAVIVVVARLGGSPAPTGTVLLLAVISILISGSAGLVAGRTKAPGG